MKNKNVKKSNLQICFFVLAAVLIFGVILHFEVLSAKAQNGEDNIISGRHLKIGVLCSDNGINSTQIYDSFVERCTLLADQNGITLDFMHGGVEIDDEAAFDYAETLSASDCDIIAAVDEKSAVMLSHLQSEIPVVFASVRDPEKEGLVESNSFPGGRITGISDFTPCFEHINLIRELFPDCKKIGIIYTKKDENSITQRNIAEYQANSLGISLNEYPVTDFNDIESTLKSMTAENDVIYLPEDEKVIEKAPQICGYFTDRLIPVIAGSESMMQSGCLATYVIDYTEVGRLAAEIVFDIGINGSDPSSIPVQYTSECDMQFDIATAVKIHYLPKISILLKGK